MIVMAKETKVKKEGVKSFFKREEFRIGKVELAVFIILLAYAVFLILKFRSVI